MSDAAVAELAPSIGVRGACEALGVAQAGYYRRHRTSPALKRPAPVPHRNRAQPRALSAAEQQEILHELHSDRLVDLAPAEVWAILLDEGRYLGSISTFYRLLRRAGETRERRAQATHPATVKPELAAAEPNAVWSWDITKLPGRPSLQAHPSTSRQTPAGHVRCSARELRRDGRPARDSSIAGKPRRSSHSDAASSSTVKRLGCTSLTDLKKVIEMRPPREYGPRMHRAGG